MNVDYFRTLFDYNYWARDRVLAVMGDLPEAEYARENGFTYGSLRGIMTHWFDSEVSYRCRFTGETDPPVLAVGDVATPAQLEERWREEESKMRDFIAGLTDARLDAAFVYRRANGEERRMPNLWLSLAHLINHSTQHRSEAAEALTMIGRSPGDLDLGLYGREKLS